MKKKVSIRNIGTIGGGPIMEGILQIVNKLPIAPLISHPQMKELIDPFRDEKILKKKEKLEVQSLIQDKLPSGTRRVVKLNKNKFTR